MSTQSETLEGQTEEFVRLNVLELMCPWCGRGPWKAVASHINRAHGITAAELRDFAGLTVRDRLTAQTTFDLRSASATENWAHVKDALREGAQSSHTPRRSTKAETRRLSSFGSDTEMRVRANRSRWEDDGVRCKAGLHIRAEVGTVWRGGGWQCSECATKTDRASKARQRMGADLGKTFKHGLSGRTNRGCRCDVCAEAFREYKRAYRAKMKTVSKEIGDD